MRRLRPLLGLVFTLTALACVGNSLAAPNIAYLGKPTNAVPPYLPLGSFRQAHAVLRSGGKPEALFLGTAVDQDSAVQRWPVVKALDQFGTWSGLQPTISPHCHFANMTTHPTCGKENGMALDFSMPTFDWSHARFSSKYIVLVQKDLIDRDAKVRQDLSATERQLFDRFVQNPGYSNWSDMLWHTAIDPQGEGGRQFPLLAVGGYVETGANLVTVADLSPKTGGPWQPLSFTAIQVALQSGHATGDVPASLIPDVNAEANVITALICHADKLQPRSVCNRSVIKSILRHVK